MAEDEEPSDALKRMLLRAIDVLAQRDAEGNPTHKSIRIEVKDGIKERDVIIRGPIQSTNDAKIGERSVQEVLDSSDLLCELAGSANKMNLAAWQRMPDFHGCVVTRREEVLQWERQMNQQQIGEKEDYDQMEALIQNLSDKFEPIWECAASGEIEAKWNTAQSRDALTHFASCLLLKAERQSFENFCACTDLDKWSEEISGNLNIYCNRSRLEGEEAMFFLKGMNPHKDPELSLRLYQERRELGIPKIRAACY